MFNDVRLTKLMTTHRADEVEQSSSLLYTACRELLSGPAGPAPHPSLARARVCACEHCEGETADNPSLSTGGLGEQTLVE